MTIPQRTPNSGSYFTHPSFSFFLLLIPSNLFFHIQRKEEIVTATRPQRCFFKRKNFNYRFRNLSLQVSIGKGKEEREIERKKEDGEKKIEKFQGNLKNSQTQESMKVSTKFLFS